MNECINVYEGFEYQTRLSIKPLMTWQNIATKQYSYHKMVTFQCLQIDQVGNSRNDITQNDLKNFSATYNLKIGTWGQQRLEITANLLFMLDTGPPIQIYRYFIIFFWFILLKNVNVDSVSRSSLNQSTKG